MSNRIIFINRNGLPWRDAPPEYGPPKMLYNRWKCWRDKGVFARILLEPADENSTTVRRDVAEARVPARIKRGLLTPEVKRNFVQTAMRECDALRRDTGDEVTSLQRRIVQLDKKIATLLDQLEDGLVRAEVVRERLDERIAQKEALERKLQKMMDRAKSKAGALEEPDFDAA